MSIYIIGESPTTEDSSALYEACRRGLTEEAQFFILEDPDQVNKRREEDGTTPLYVAAEKGHLDIVEKLIEAGAITNEPCWNGAQALFVLHLFFPDEQCEGTTSGADALYAYELK
jgi:ankyrin repeat protein